MRMIVGRILLATTAFWACHHGDRLAAQEPVPEPGKLRSAVTDLIETFGERYPDGPEILERLRRIELRLAEGNAVARRELEHLRREALLANPLLDCRALLVRRRAKNPITGVAIPAPHQSNSGLKRTGYDNEIAILDLGQADAKPSTLFRPDDEGYVGEVDLHWDGERMLFTRSDRTSWKLWEMRLDGSALRQVSQTPDDVDCFDGCYLPDGGVVFASTASYQSVPCWHGQMPAGHLYRMNADGSSMRQLCFDQDIDAHPVVLGNGQIMFNRWDYTGINHIFLRQLMVMNPDGTGQRSVYGSNSWFPNSLFFFRPLPKAQNQLVSILSGYHGVPRMGWLVTLDPSHGWRDAGGLTNRLSGIGAPIRPVIRDAAVDDDWPKFLHPYPLSDKHFLVSCLTGPTSQWGLYYADVHDNLLKLYGEPDDAILEPIVIEPRPEPPRIPDRVDLSQDEATIYLKDIYAGPGLAGLPRGTVKQLRVISYHFGYRGLAGSDKIGYGGPWDGMRIEGIVPLEHDGSAMFKVPANTPLAFQPLDAEGKAVQLMRSWFTAMPGEQRACVGCHESPAETGDQGLSAAALRPPRRIEPWYGPARGFDFAREVQPVLDRHCTACHDGQGAEPDLRPEARVENRNTWPIGYPKRLSPEMQRDTGGRMTYTPAYDALIHYLRRPGIEDDVSLLRPYEYHADTSPLIQLLRKGHQGVRLSAEDWDRLITWIDLNGPCHGTWGEVYPIPNGAHQRRMELRAMYGGPRTDPETIYEPAPVDRTPIKPDPLPNHEPLEIEDWPLAPDEASRRQNADGLAPLSLDLGAGIRLQLTRLPAGRFVMGAADGEPDEQPPAAVAIDEPFWMGTFEVTNEQFARYDPAHTSGYYIRRLPRPDGQGLPLDAPDQPVVRVSWREAAAFCDWLAKRTALPIALPTERQWEYACRAGSAASFAFGDDDADFSVWENLADATFGRGVMQPQAVHPETVTQWSGGVPHLVLEGAKLADDRFGDGFSVTAPVGRFRPNAWGLYDLHGNAAEWTASPYRPYPYAPDAEHLAPEQDERRVVRGGSFFDPPARSRSASRRAYHPWQPVFNVGFRIVCNTSRLCPQVGSAAFPVLNIAPPQSGGTP
jgi:formylglycine-generating enzyme required for sulfatase activity